MNTLATLQQQHQAAQATLDELKADLPRFHSLLTDNEQAANQLRQDKADLDEQAQARNRVMVAREMLQQHQGDVASARQEVARLEAIITRERTLLQMVEHSKEAKAERERLDKAFLRLARELQRATRSITEAWTAENEARQAFAREGYKLMPQEPSFMDITAAQRMNDQARQDASRLEQDLQERGAELEAIKDATTGRFSFMDPYGQRELPRDTVSVLLWEAVRLLTEDDPKAHNLRRLTPKRAHPTTKFVALLEAGGVAHG